MTDFPEQRIFYLDFDRGTFLTENNQLPLQHEQIDWIRSWHGAAGRFTSSLGSQLRYAYRQDNQALNIRLQAGSLRCWLKPQWDPLNPPRGVGRLIELGTWDPQGALGWWALQFNHDRERFQFITQAAGGSVYQFDAPIDLSSEEWYQFTVTWNALESRFYLNGSQKGRGPGISNYPDEATANASGLRIGSALHGNLSAEVILDDLEIFNHALDSEEILSNFQATRPDEDGDGIISKDEGFLLLDPLDPDTDYDGVSDGQELKDSRISLTPKPPPSQSSISIYEKEPSFSGSNLIGIAERAPARKDPSLPWDTVPTCCPMPGGIYISMRVDPGYGLLSKPTADPLSRWIIQSNGLLSNGIRLF
ncbi:MAG: LamG domain-containing protein [Verrucomicrobia bacterium]|nr:LamG domain-containing protein [Verrucomicrobiota bacterium]